MSLQRKFYWMLFFCWLLFTSQSCKQPAETVLNPTETASALPHSMKGYELYGWVENETTFFTFITGTNRLKTVAEITADDADVISNAWIRIKVAGVDSVKQLAKRLPQNENIVYYPGFGDLPAPPVAVGEMLKAWYEQFNLHFFVVT